MCESCEDQFFGRILDALEAAVPFDTVAPSERESLLFKLARHFAGAAAAEHERAGCGNNPESGACWSHRANLIAYLAHSLGYTPSMSERIRQILDGYEGAHVKRHGMEG